MNNFADDLMNGRLDGSITSGKMDGWLNSSVAQSVACWLRWVALFLAVFIYLFIPNCLLCVMTSSLHFLLLFNYFLVLRLCHHAQRLSYFV